MLERVQLELCVGCIMHCTQTSSGAVTAVLYEILTAGSISRQPTTCYWLLWLLRDYMIGTRLHTYYVSFSSLQLVIVSVCDFIWLNYPFFVTKKTRYPESEISADSWDPQCVRFFQTRLLTLTHTSTDSPSSFNHSHLVTGSPNGLNSNSTRQNRAMTENAFQFIFAHYFS